MKTSARNINIKEVRVGNYLLGNQYSYEDNYQVFQVESIHENGLNVWDGREMGILADYEWENAKPIPLDENWVRSLGFKDDNESLLLGNISYYKGGITVRAESDDFHGTTVEHIKYVHQLQNLYFALTGNELSAE